MRRTKKWLLSALVVACTATTAVAAACNKKHEHAYTTAVTAPTCTTEGFTTHKCECGESYVDTKVAALGHDYYSKVVTYPSVTEAGERKITCTRCDYVKTEAIEALTVSMPKVSDLLVGVIGSVNAQIAVDEDSMLLVEKVYEVPKGEAVGETITVSFELAEAMLSTQDGTLQGHVKVKVNTSNVAHDEGDAAVSTENAVGEVYLYVNGDAVSFEMVDFTGETMEQETSLSEIVYTALAEATGMTYDDVVTLAYVGGEVVDYVPAVLKLLGENLPTVSESYITNVQTLLQAVGQDIIVESTEGTNSVYTVDLTALGHFVDEVKDVSVGEYVDKVFGAGSMTAVKNFVTALPEKTVKDVVNSAIALSNNYGIDVYHVYFLVNLTAHQMGATDFDIQAMIESQYNKTLGGLIIEASGDEELTVATMKQQLELGVTMVSGLTLDSLYNMITGEEDEEFSFTAQLEEMIENLPNMATATLVFDELGAFVSANTMVGPYSLAISADGVQLSATVNGVEVDFNANANGISLSATQEEFVLANIEFLQSATGYTADVTVNGNDYFDLDAEVENNIVTEADIVIREVEGGYEEKQWNDDTQMEETVYVPEEVVVVAEIAYVATVEEGKVTTAQATIKGWSYDYNLYEEVYKEVAKLTYTDTDGKASFEGIFEDEGKITLTEVSNANGATWTLKVIDLKGGVNDDETVDMATGTFSYVQNDTQVTYTADLVIHEENLGDVLDFEATLDNGVIVSYNFAMRELGGRSGHGHEYEMDGVQYRDSVTQEEELSFEISYENEKLTYSLVYNETETELTEFYDETNHVWAESSSSSSENGVAIELSVEATDDGVLVSVNGMEIDLSVLENGVEIAANAEGMVDGVITVTVVDGVLHIEYDLETVMAGDNTWIEGAGGISVSLSIS